MAKSDSEFEIRLGATRQEKPTRLRALRKAVQTAIRKPSAAGPRPKQGSIRAHFAKGASQKQRVVAATTRRVVVKMRYASNTGGKGAPLRAHVAYLAREACTQTTGAPALTSEGATELGRSVDYLSREGVATDATFSFYERASDAVDARAVTAGWTDDPRHFRMIVSAEDGEALGDLKPFIRELMSGLEAKLGTRVQWVAVDHHDTDNPHTHVLIRGRRPDGHDLFIPSRLIGSGIREHAQEIVTRALGPRLDVDLVKERAGEIALRAPTPLDREILRTVREGRAWPERPDHNRRLEALEGWGLADRETGAWRLADGLVGKLTALAEADDLERAIAPLRVRGDPMVLLEANKAAIVTGELVLVRVADEFGDRYLAVLETGEGELRYARFEKAEDLAILADIQSGAIVSFEPNLPQVRPSDLAVARIAEQTAGLYSPQLHAAIEGDVPREMMAANVRRLEAMRRIGLVERRTSGEFEVGGEHRSTALAFERKLTQRAPLAAKVGSYWPLAEQISATGPTELDRALAGQANVPLGEGALTVRYEQALQQRRQFLIEQGWMGEHEQGPSRLAMQRMATLELTTKAKELSGELGLHVLTHVPNRVAGVYARRLDLAQGRMILILGDRQAVLAPWRPTLERFAGRQVEGVLSGQSLSWKLARGLGIGLAHG